MYLFQIIIINILQNAKMLQEDTNWNDSGFSYLSYVNSSEFCYNKNTRKSEILTGYVASCWPLSTAGLFYVPEKI